MEQDDLERATSIPLPLSPEPVDDVSHTQELSNTDSLQPVARDPINENYARSEVELATEQVPTHAGEDNPLPSTVRTFSMLLRVPSCLMRLYLTCLILSNRLMKYGLTPLFSNPYHALSHRRTFSQVQMMTVPSHRPRQLRLTHNSQRCLPPCVRRVMVSRPLAATVTRIPTTSPLRLSVLAQTVAAQAVLRQSERIQEPTRLMPRESL